jgi:hypothetical protein
MGDSSPFSENLNESRWAMHDIHVLFSFPERDQQNVHGHSPDIHAALTKPTPHALTGRQQPANLSLVAT